MKIGVFHPPTRFEAFGGSLVVTVTLVNALTGEGYDVTLFTIDKIDQQKLADLIGERLSEKVKVTIKPSIFRSRSLINLYDNAIKLLTLKQKCDLVIDTFSCYVFPWTDVCYIHFPYINNIFFKRNFPYLKKRKGILKESINLPYLFFARNIQNYDRKLLIANSYFTANAITEAMKVDAKVLYPPITASFLKYSCFDERRENIVVTIGRITEDKKVEAIPKIANRVRDKDVKFIIIGFLHDKNTLYKVNAEIQRLGLKDRIKIFTNISKRDQEKILKSAKVYLHPPTIEHFGISIAEAMALGCIPVVYEVGGAKEFVPKNFIYSNLEEAAKKVEKAIDTWSQKEAKRMNSIAQNFSEHNFRRNFLQMFSDYCNETSS
ncbi:MAG: glycosyltransferase family 4 protein [Nitrososphaeria archaeon]